MAWLGAVDAAGRSTAEAVEEALYLSIWHLGGIGPIATMPAMKLVAGSRAQPSISLWHAGGRHRLLSLPTYG
jgi:hypothetical protein